VFVDGGGAGLGEDLVGVFGGIAAEDLVFVLVLVVDVLTAFFFRQPGALSCLDIQR
jgi:hypothetical protein